MSMDIYNNGTYLEKNKTIHSEDSEYKFSYIKKLIKEIDFSNTTVKVLDVGGGAGLIGKFLCEYIISQNKTVEFYALDLSLKMLEIQKINNKNIVKTYALPLDELNEKNFDLILMIDVIEHIPNKEITSKLLNTLTKNIIYNIPLELNLFDRLRNYYMKGNYYKIQTKTIGHIHFFSYLSALRFVEKYHKLKKYYFADYSSHILSSSSEEYISQKNNKLRRLELKISSFLFKYLKIFSPYIIQGSLFILVEKDDKKSS